MGLESDTVAIPVLNPGSWTPTQEAFPDCAVVTHSNSLFTPSQLFLEMDSTNEIEVESNSFCDDPFFIQQVRYLTVNVFDCKTHSNVSRSRFFYGHQIMLKLKFYCKNDFKNWLSDNSGRILM